MSEFAVPEGGRRSKRAAKPVESFTTYVQVRPRTGGRSGLCGWASGRRAKRRAEAPQNQNVARARKRGDVPKHRPTIERHAGMRGRVATRRGERARTKKPNPTRTVATHFQVSSYIRSVPGGAWVSTKLLGLGVGRRPKLPTRVVPTRYGHSFRAPQLSAPAFPP